MYAGRGDKEGRVEIKTKAAAYRETPSSGLSFNPKVDPHTRISKATQINENTTKYKDKLIQIQDNTILTSHLKLTLQVER